MLDTRQVEEQLSLIDPGLRLVYLPEAESTNTSAWQYYTPEEALPDRVLVITDHQVSGRGRAANTWHAQPGAGLTLSLLVQSKINAEFSGLLPIAAGLAVSEAMQLLSITVGLKWPNDIMFADKKIGGILCESRINNNSVTGAVIGIGLNINDDPGKFPPEIQESASSLAFEFGKIFSREDILQHICSRLYFWIDKIVLLETKYIAGRWVEDAIFLDQEIVMNVGDNLIDGIFKGITLHGEARIDCHGEILNVNSGIMSKLRNKK